MVSQNLETVLRQAKLLSNEERAELRRRLDLLANGPAPRDPEEILLAQGLLKSLPRGKDPRDGKRLDQRPAEFTSHQ